MGTSYSGFQAQKNANTIQSEVEKAFEILQKERVAMVGSSRTDAGVHAIQNFFHFDFDENIDPHFVYKMNALLPADIAVKNILPVSDTAHARFNAINREYKYYIYRFKNPFLDSRAYYYPYKLDVEKLSQLSELLINYSDFSSFSKRKTQVKTFNCDIMESEWYWQDEVLIYRVRANRFLRGMVRALVATMLWTSREEQELQVFKSIIEMKDQSRAKFSVPAHGLYLEHISFPKDIFK